MSIQLEKVRAKVVESGNPDKNLIREFVDLREWEAPDFAT